MNISNFLKLINSDNYSHQNSPRHIGQLFHFVNLMQIFTTTGARAPVR